MSNKSRFSKDVRFGFVDAVCSGIPLAAAGASLGVSECTAERWWAESGGMKLKRGHGGLDDPAISDGIPDGRFLTLAERAVIQFGRRRGLSYAAIGTEIGRDKSVVCREVQRNKGPDGIYYAKAAHGRAHHRAHRPKLFKLLQSEALCHQIETSMDQGWSPKLISSMLAKTFPDDETMRVSYETIYQALYVQTRGNLRADLNQQLSLKRRKRVSAARRGASSSLYKNAFTISDRPAEAKDRAVPGHWEGDLLLGKKNKSAIGTLVERSTRFTILLHLPDRHTSDEVATAMIAAMIELPEHLRRSITWDRGSELAEYERIQVALETKLFFCDPRSPWQRGTNENTNRLLRHWFEKDSNLSVYTAADLKRVQNMLNRRPRPTLNLDTPAQSNMR